MPTMKSRIIPFLTLTACLCFHVIVAEEENDDVSDGFEDDDVRKTMKILVTFARINMKTVQLGLMKGSVSQIQDI